MLKDYPEQVFNETQKLLGELQKLPDFKLSESMFTDSQGSFSYSIRIKKKSEKPKTCPAVRPFIIEFVHSIMKI